MDDDWVIDLGEVSDNDPTHSDDQTEVDGAYASGRLTGHTYASKSFPHPFRKGVPARFIYKVFDPESESELERTAEGNEYLVRETPAGRRQLKMMIAGEPGNVEHLWYQEITTKAGHPHAETVLSLDGADAANLIELARSLQNIPVEGEESRRIDDALVKELFASPETLTRLYKERPELFHRLISDDAAARDVVALERRRVEVDRFRRLLDDDEFFEAAVAATPGNGRERVWQDFFEANPWILGVGLGGQLYTSWDAKKLEQVVGGSSIAQKGKRTDALMRTSGVVRWMTFAEFKTHKTNLLDERHEYRPAVWAPSHELAGGVAQAQATVRRALKEIGEVIRGTAKDGSDIPGDLTFLTRPRSFLVIGHLSELIGEGGGPHMDKVRSFELFRRALTDPEVVTFDELLARAEWVVEMELAEEVAGPATAETVPRAGPIDRPVGIRVEGRRAGR